MKRLLTACLLLLLGAPLAAQPNLVVNAAATAQGATSKPVTVEVTVENRGKEASQPKVLVLRFVPKVSAASKGSGQTLRDPLELKQTVPEMNPGEKQVLQFKTPYDATSTFRNQKRPFKATNIDPTGEVTVEFTARLE
ncbi:MAG: hypothetical protein HY319_32680 [Armatimonadetes bacterium]|nr:hypothetical protein [Armatimonadota bacterium]